MKQTTDEEHQAVWEMLLLRSNRGVLKHGDIVLTAAHFHLSRFIVSRIWERGICSMGERVAAGVKSRKSARGRKKLNRKELCERISTMSVIDRENHRKIQIATNTSPYLICQLMKEGYMRRALRQTRPLLMIMDNEGRNSFRLGHMHKDKLIHAGELPTTLSCDAELLFKAHAAIASLTTEQLYAEQLQASVPPAQRSTTSSSARRCRAPASEATELQNSLHSFSFETSDLDIFLL